MFGCLRKLGCLVIIVAAAGGYYWYSHHHGTSADTTVAAGTWIPVTTAAAERGQAAIQSLQGTGKSYVHLSPAEAAGYLLLRSAKGIPASAQSTQASITGNTLHVRSVVDLRQIGASHLLGPVASMFSGPDTLELSGTTDVVRTGMAQLRVTNVKFHDITLPSAVIPKLLDQLRGPAPAGVAADGVPLILPPYVGDVRIANGRVIVYKNV